MGNTKVSKIQNIVLCNIPSEDIGWLDAPMDEVIWVNSLKASKL